MVETSPLPASGTKFFENERTPRGMSSRVIHSRSYYEASERGQSTSFVTRHQAWQAPPEDTPA
ncbi:MAG: hypothetical protein M3430_16065 [Acidobacteriota bacterium]|nr:hypothetical protein [Acidobacteriota bacterium]